MHDLTVYAIDSGAVVVNARSTIHDTRTRWDSLSGRIEADPADLAGGAAAVDLAVDMRRFDAGDFLRNRKLRNDLEVDRHREARFRLTALREVEDRGGGRFAARAEGAIEWRGRSVAIEASGEGELDGRRLRATARFEIDVRAFGVAPPRFLLFKVDDVVAIEVTLTASRAGP